MRYWFSLFSVGVFRGGDAILMVLRIEIEICKIPEDNIATELRRIWIERRGFIEGEGKRLVSTLEPLYHFKEVALRNKSDNRLFRDFDRMLVGKGQKTRTYLFHLETLMNTSLEAGNIETAKELRERLRDLCQRLNDEEMFELHQEFDLDHGMSCLSLKNEENSSYIGKW